MPISPWKQRERELNARYNTAQSRMFHISTVKVEPKPASSDGGGKSSAVPARTVGVTYRRDDK